jgi:class 3 adenylate cyclase
VLIGSDPEEYWVGARPAKDIIRIQFREMGPVTIVAGDIRAYCSGDVGWVADNPTMTLADGTVLKLRGSFVFNRERGAWTMVHQHTSVGAPSIEAWGRAFTTSLDAVADAVELDRPDLAPVASRDGTVTIVFTDIEGSTELNERLGDARWREVLKEHIEAVQRCTQDHGGETVERAGDGFMLAFPSATNSLRCAVELQRRLSVREDPSCPIRVRIGAHAGEPIREADAFFGRDVAYAARVAAVAKGGEVLASNVLRELTRRAGEVEFGAARECTFKGFDGTQTVYPVTRAAAAS